MNQMEHNYKIKDYKPYQNPPPYVQTNYDLNRSQTFRNAEETRRLEERLRYVHWPREHKLGWLPDHGDRMRFTRNQQISVLHNQHENIVDVDGHRQLHYEHTRHNGDVARAEFDRSVRLGRPGVLDKMRGPPPLFKVINNGTLRG